MSRRDEDGGLIRPMLPTDLEQVLAWRNHPEIRRYMYTQHEITLEEHVRWFGRAGQDPSKRFVIFERNNQPTGFVNFTELGNGGIADWGFYVAPDAPAGSGRELGVTALDYAFTQLKFHKVCGEALAYNQRSIRFHLSLGFSQEGVMRDQHFDGEHYHDVVHFGLLDREWVSNR